ncbi:MAG: PASTA domain-containing protein [Gemmatimonadetes bacterium]|nr:PASTA domain-containing protein [Gemmatimonadota bacterium]
MNLGSSIRRRRKGGRPDEQPRRPLPEGVAALVSPRVLGIAAALAVVGLGGGFLFATQVLFPAPELLTGFVEVPDVRGNRLSDVEAVLAEAGLELGAVDRFSHPLADSGSVVGQAPLPGQLILPGQTVRVATSIGADRRPIPTVSRLVGAQAADLLRASGFTVTVDSAESDLPRGGVVEVVPEEGTSLSLPAEVRLTLSLGPPSVEVPALLGLSEVVARDSLTALGLVVGDVEEVFRFGRDQGRVVGQEPPAGTEMERGAAVRLVVGRRGGG